MTKNTKTARHFGMTLTQFLIVLVLGVLVLCLAMVLILLFTRNNQGQPLTQIQASSTISAQIDLSISQTTDNMIVVNGSTNLPDETIIMVTISGIVLDYSAQDRVSVSNGKFTAGPFSSAGYGVDEGKYTVEALMPYPAVQPESVRKIIGNEGERLSGNQVVIDNGVLVVATKEFEVVVPTPTYISPLVNSTTTPEIIFKDDFQDSGTTSVNWSPLGGTWVVENGVLSCTANGKYLANMTMPEDFTFQVDIMGVNVVDKIIVLRVVDDSTHYGIDFRTAPYNDIVLVKSLPGNIGQIIQTIPFENYDNIWYTIKVDVENNHIKAFVNDQPMIDFIDVSSPITGGTVGVGAMLQLGFSIVYYDNVEISTH